MIIFFILLLSIVLSDTGMELPLEKRKGTELEHLTKFARGSFNQPILMGIAEDTIKIILEYVMSANGSSHEAEVTSKEKINFTVKGVHQDVDFNKKFKGFHPCFLVNKKLSRFSTQVQKNLFIRLGQKYPKEMMRAINEACESSKRIFCLQRLIAAVPELVFDLTPRVTPVNIAAYRNNEIGVQYLLDEAKKRGIEKQYVNLRIDPTNTGKGTYGVEDGALDAALTHIVAPIGIIKRLLEVGANPNNGSLLHSLVDLEIESIPNPETFLQAAEELCKAGANPNLPREWDTRNAYQYAQASLTEINDLSLEAPLTEDEAFREDRVKNYLVALMKIFDKSKTT